MILKKISAFFYRYANNTVLVVFILLFLFFNLFILPQHSLKSASELPPFDLTFGYDVSYSTQFLTQLGEEGRVTYIRFLMIYDTIYPFIYGGLMAVVLSLLLRSKLFTKRVQLLNLLPILAIFADFVENSCSIYTTFHFPTVFDYLVQIGSFFTQLKWSLIFLNSGLALFLGVKLLVLKKHGASS